MYVYLQFKKHYNCNTGLNDYFSWLIVLVTKETIFFNFSYFDHSENWPAQPFLKVGPQLMFKQARKRAKPRPGDD